MHNCAKRILLLKTHATRSTHLLHRPSTTLHTVYLRQRPQFRCDGQHEAGRHGEREGDEDGMVVQPLRREPRGGARVGRQRPVRVLPPGDARRAPPARCRRREGHDGGGAPVSAKIAGGANASELPPGVRQEARGPRGR
jgi:hypothetical protein